jgi:hypothetical protein
MEILLKARGIVSSTLILKRISNESKGKKRKHTERILMTAKGIVISTLMESLLKAKEKGVGNTLKGFLMTGRGIVISNVH